MRVCVCVNVSESVKSLQVLKTHGALLGSTAGGVCVFDGST